MPIRSVFRDAAVKRLLSDYEELQQLDLSTIAAAPLENNLFQWHCNVLVPWTSDYRGAVFHLKIDFPEDYPRSPPYISLLSNSLSHSHVYGSWICLDLLGTHLSSESYFGWSSAYTISSVLLQLQSFFLEEEHLVTSKVIRDEIKESNNYSCSKCGHDAPSFSYWPWKPSWSKEVTFEHPGHCELGGGRRMPAQRRFQRQAYKKGNGIDTSGDKFAKVNELIKHRHLCESFRQQLRKRNHPNWQTMTHSELESHFAQEMENMRLQKEREAEQKREAAELEAKRLQEAKRAKQKQLEARFQELKGWDSDDVVWSICQFLNIAQLTAVCPKINAQWASIAQKLFVHTEMRQQLQCFYTKSSMFQDTLGIGVTLEYAPKRKGSNHAHGRALQYVDTPLDLLSRTAFFDLDVRKSVWNQPIQEWVPIMLTRNHANDAFPLLEKAMSRIYKSEDPENIIDFVSKLMNSMIVKMMNGEKHASCSALEGYIHCYRILVEAIMQYPHLRSVIDEKLRLFLASEEYRIKENCPSIGNLLPLISVSSYEWEDLIEKVVEETRDRNALWILKKYDDLDTLSPHESQESRIRKCFDACQVSLRLLSYHQAFLTQVVTGKKEGLTLREICALCDETFGKPLPDDLDKFQELIFEIQSISTYQEALQYLGFAKEQLTTANVHRMLMDSFKNSLRKGYHRSNHCIKVSLAEKLFGVNPLQSEKPSQLAWRTSPPAVKKLTPCMLYEMLSPIAPLQSVHMLGEKNAIVRVSSKRYKQALVDSISIRDDLIVSTRCRPFNPPDFTGTTSRVYVRGCSNRDTLENLFSQHCDARIEDFYSNKEKNFSIVTFETVKQAKEATELDGRVLDNATYIRVQEAKERRKKMGTPRGKKARAPPGEKNFHHSDLADGWKVIGATRRNRGRRSHRRR